MMKSSYNTAPRRSIVGGGGSQDNHATLQKKNYGHELIDAPQFVQHRLSPPMIRQFQNCPYHINASPTRGVTTPPSMSAGVTATDTRNCSSPTNSDSSSMIFSNDLLGLAAHRINKSTTTEVTANRNGNFRRTSGGPTTLQDQEARKALMRNIEEAMMLTSLPSFSKGKRIATANVAGIHNAMFPTTTDGKQLLQPSFHRRRRSSQWKEALETIKQNRRNSLESSSASGGSSAEHTPAVPTAAMVDLPRLHASQQQRQSSTAFVPMINFSATNATSSVYDGNIDNPESSHHPLARSNYRVRSKLNLCDKSQMTFIPYKDDSSSSNGDNDEE